MHQEETKSDAPYFKIDQNGMMDIVGDFNPETFADILYIITRPEFYNNAVKYFSTKYSGTDFEKKFLDRIEAQIKTIKNIEEAFVHPLQSWKGLNEN